VTAFFPSDHARRATEAIARSALPDAPVRSSRAATIHRRRGRTMLGGLLIAIGRRLLAVPPWLEPATAAPDDRYTSWRAAAVLCADALVSWHESGSADRPAAHAVYLAALDREEAAARELARSTRRWG
jgi:hypothetical protein